MHALKGISCVIEQGDYVAITGASGSGKSTLLAILGLLDRYDTGSYRVAGREVAELSERELTQLRAEFFGFVFQSFNLIPRLTALENVARPLFYRGVTRKQRIERALKLLQQVGLAERAEHFPHQLSGGEMQRVATARALIGEPACILADEPTGNLDSASGELIIAMFEDLVQSESVSVNTFIIVTHDEKLATRAAKRIRISDGHIV